MSAAADSTLAEDYSSSFLREPIAGAFAGITGTALGYPLDVIKTRMQVSHSSASAALRSVVSESGAKGLYRGMTSPLTALTVLNTLNFSSYAYFCRRLGAGTGERETRVEWRYGVAAAAIGPLASCVSTPFEMVKTQLQLAKKNTATHASEQGKVTGSLSMALYLAKTHGLRSLYTAYTVNTVRESIFLSTYFMVYEHSRGAIEGFLSVHENLAIPICGGISGALGWLISFPLDNIKSNIQGFPLNHQPPKAVEIAKKLLKTHGATGLYSGIGPSIMRAFIVSASRFSAYEVAIKLMQD